MCEQPLSKFEQSLSALRPAQAGLDRDELLFRAGRQSVQGRLRIWRGACGVVALALALALLRPAAAPAPGPVVVQRPTENAQPVQLAEASPDRTLELEAAGRRMALQNKAINEGIDAVLIEITPPSRNPADSIPSTPPEAM